MYDFAGLASINKFDFYSLGTEKAKIKIFAPRLGYQHEKIKQNKNSTKHQRYFIDIFWFHQHKIKLLCAMME